MYEIRRTKWNASEKVESIDFFVWMIKLKHKEREKMNNNNNKLWTKSMMQEEHLNNDDESDVRLSEQF